MLYTVTEQATDRGLRFDDLLAQEALKGDSHAEAYLISGIWGSIERMVERLPPQLIDRHPIYNDRCFVEELCGDLFIERILPQWHKTGMYSFSQWFDRFGYKKLRSELCRELARTDPYLSGLYDTRLGRWRIDEEASQTIPEDEADEFYRPASLVKPHIPLWRVVRKLAGWADELTDRQWRGVLTDGEVSLLTCLLERMSLQEAAIEERLSYTWWRRRALRAARKAAEAIKQTQDERLGLVGIPDWPETYRELKRLEQMVSWAPNSNRAKILEN